MTQPRTGDTATKAELPPLPFCQADIGEDEIAEVVDTIRSGWLTTGPKTRRFEEQFRDYVGSKFAVAVSSCTAGLHLMCGVNDLAVGLTTMWASHRITSIVHISRA